MKWFRWRGLVPFVILAALIAVFWFLLVDSYVERVIERVGTEAVGAKVELASADLSLFPLGLTLEGLQVTNPDEPMRNAVEAKRIAFTMDGAWLLMRKVIIEEMTVDGVKLDTPRKYSGAVEKTVRKTAEEKVERAKFKLESIDLPDVKKLLEKEDLETVKLANSVREEIEAEKERWRKRIEELPGEEKIKEYRKRIKALESTRADVAGIVGAASEVAALRKDIEKDLEAVKSARRDFAELSESLQDKLRDAMEAPKRDFNRLRKKYGISPKGLANLSEVILGPRIASYVRKALYWRGRLEPVFREAQKKEAEEPQAVKPPRAKGLDVHYKERDPKPDFLIRKALVSVSLDVGDVSGTVEDITAEQYITGRPTTFRFAGEDLDGLDSVSLEGAINRVRPDKPRDSADLAVKGYALREAALSRAGELPVAMKEGLADLSVDALLAGGEIDATARGLFKSLKIEARAPGGNELMKVMADALGDIKTMDFSAKITGPLDDYKVSISSNLDAVLKNALAKQVRAQVGKWEAGLTEAIAEKAGPQLESLKKDAGGLDVIREKLSSRVDGFNGLLKDLPSSGSGGFKLPF